MTQTSTNYGSAINAQTTSISMQQLNWYLIIIGLMFFVVDIVLGVVLLYGQEVNIGSWYIFVSFLVFEGVGLWFLSLRMQI